jgi:hypothetical protein
MTKITIEDECGEQRAFNVSDAKLVEKISSCLNKKQKEKLGKEKSSTIKMIGRDGDIVGAFLQREDDGCLSVMMFDISNGETVEYASQEVYFTSDGETCENNNFF